MGPFEESICLLPVDRTRTSPNRSDIGNTPKFSEKSICSLDVDRDVAQHPVGAFCDVDGRYGAVLKCGFLNDFIL